MRTKLQKFFTRLILSILGLCVIVVTLFLFLYVFWKGKKVFSLSFLLDKPAGVPLGTAGGIYPALMGSIYLGALSALIGGILGIGAAIYLVFYSTGKRFSVLVNMAITGLSGIPSILFGLVGYTLLIYRFGLNRSLLCSALCVAAMIIPFVAIRAEKILEEKGREYMKNSLSLGLSREYALRKLILPVCSVELLGTVALGMAYGMGADFIHRSCHAGRCSAFSLRSVHVTSISPVYPCEQRIFSGLCLWNRICTDALPAHHPVNM